MREYKVVTGFVFAKIDLEDITIVHVHVYHGGSSSTDIIKKHLTTAIRDCNKPGVQTVHCPNVDHTVTRNGEENDSVDSETRSAAHDQENLNVETEARSDARDQDNDSMNTSSSAY